MRPAFAARCSLSRVIFSAFIVSAVTVAAPAPLLADEVAAPAAPSPTAAPAEGGGSMEMRRAHGDGEHGDCDRPRGLSDLGGADCDDCEGDADEGCDCPDCKGEHDGEHHGMAHRHDDGMPPRAPHLPPPVFALLRHVMGNMPQPQALLQTQMAMYTGQSAQIARGDRAEVMGFGMRRARMGLEGGIGRHLSYGVSVDLASNPQSNGGALGEAWFGIKLWRTGEVIIGAQRTPYLREAILSAGHGALAERSFSANAMSPYRQVGVTLGGKYDLAGLEWYLGAYNAFERGVNFYQGFREFSGFTGNRFGGIALVGRLSAAPLGKMGPTIYDADGGSLRVAVGASGYSSDGGTTRMNGVSADVHAKLKGAHVLVQYLRDTANPKEAPTEPGTINSALTRQAIVAEAGYAWRRINAAARYELIDPDTSRTDDMDGQVMSVALGVQLPRDRMRVQAQFDHRQESSGAALKNDVLFAMFQLML